MIYLCDERAIYATQGVYMKIVFWLLCCETDPETAENMHVERGEKIER